MVRSLFTGTPPVPRQDNRAHGKTPPARERGLILQLQNKGG